MTYFSTSMMCANFFNLESQIKTIDKYTDYYHVDLMDGNYVNNIALSLEYVKQLKRYVTKPIDVHLMVNDPSKYIDELLEMKVNCISVHYEVVTNSIFRLINKVKGSETKFGLVVNPGVKVDLIDMFHGHVDKITVMTVEPGFSGQKMIEDSLPKIAYLSKLKAENNYKFLIEIDGSNNFNTFATYLRLGAEVLILGSELFKDSYIEEKFISIINHVNDISSD